MLLIPDRKLFVLFTACLAISVISAPIPAKYGSLENPADPAPLLRGPDGKPVDMSKWPWKRDLERRGLRLSRRDSAQTPISLSKRSSQSQVPLARRAPEGPAANSDLKVIGHVEYIPWYSKRSQLIAATDALERRFWALDTLMNLERRRAAIQGDLERRWMLLDEWEELDRRLTDITRLIDESIRLSGGYGKKPLPSRRPRDADSATTPGALCSVPGAHCGSAPASPPSAGAPVPIERRGFDDLDIRSLFDIDLEELERRIDNIQQLFDEAIKANGGNHKAPRKSRRPRDANSDTTPGALCQVPGAHCGPPGPVAIERRDIVDLETRSLLDLDLEELERRIDNIQQLFNEAIKANGGNHKALRQSSRPRDADSATKQGALCNLPGAHCEPTSLPTVRSYIPDDDLATRDMDLDEYVEDIARRLLQVRSTLTNDGSLPVLHSANPSFMFESALRDAVHPHGLAPANLEGSTASFKDQLAAAARERAAKESGKS